ncbi:MAG: hypothetical protein AB7R89_09330 [Dehalococcoidia bacterium]
MESRLTRSLPLLAIVSVVVCALALHLHTAFGAESPETAVRVLVESHGAAYAGDCGSTVSPRDIGATCSKLVGEDGDVKAYLVGRTFSEFTDWVFVEDSGRGDWRIVAETPLDFHADDDSIPWP